MRPEILQDWFLESRRHNSEIALRVTLLDKVRKECRQDLALKSIGQVILWEIGRLGVGELHNGNDPTWAALCKKVTGLAHELFWCRTISIRWNGT